MKAIVEFQKTHGLVPDGVIGKKTLAKINEIIGLRSKEELAHFMGQCSHESGNFNSVTENLNYSAASLLKGFPKYFNSSNVNAYARQPEKIANRIYANRMGNGDEDSGDGWKYRGMGLIQLTGKWNHEKFADFINNPEIKENPILIASNYAFESAKFYFDSCDLWKYAKTVDDESILTISKAINLGSPNSKKIPNGLSDRLEKTKYYYNLMK